MVSTLSSVFSFDKECTSAAAYCANRNDIFAELASKDPAGNLTDVFRNVNPYPVRISSEHYTEQQRLQHVLSKVLHRVVAGFCEDSRLQAVFRLSAEVMELFEELRETPYRIGSYRPDFLIVGSRMMVCEINARFATNGFLMTQYTAEVFEKRQSGVSSRPFYTRAVDALTGRLAAGAPSYIVKEREAGYDIHLLANELSQAGYPVRVIAPGALPELAARNANCNLILELHQSEIQNPETLRQLRALCRRSPHYNDLRTVFLVHDKRMLSVFHRDDLIRDYCDSEDVAFLQAHVVPTYLPGDSDCEVLADAMDNQDQWIIKPSLFGKGEGIVLGHTVSRDRWRWLLEQCVQKQCFVLQKLVKQEQLPVLTCNNDCLSIEPMNVVGTMLCFDDTFIAPGVYRASRSEIVNVASGGTVLVPVY